MPENETRVSVTFSDGPGRTYPYIYCDCGATIKTYLWSWAGNGRRVCPTRRKEHPYWARRAENANK